MWIWTKVSSIFSVGLTDCTENNPYHFETLRAHTYTDAVTCPNQQSIIKLMIIIEAAWIESKRCKEKVEKDPRMCWNGYTATLKSILLACEPALAFLNDVMKTLSSIIKWAIYCETMREGITLMCGHWKTEYFFISRMWISTKVSQFLSIFVGITDSTENNAFHFEKLCQPRQIRWLVRTNSLFSHQRYHHWLFPMC